MSETKTKNLCTVPAADLADSQYFIAEDNGELKRVPKAQVVLKKLEDMLATDTKNLAGGGEVTAQDLLDAIADQVANKLLAKSQIVNNLLATVAGNPLDATQGKTLKDLIDTTNNNLSDKFAAKDISNGSLNQITTTGFYLGSNITEVTPYIKSYKWCLINAYVSGNSASIFVTAGDAMALSIYRNGDGIYSYYPIATKSDLAFLTPKRPTTNNLNSFYPNSPGINIHVCISSDENIPEAATGFCLSIYYDRSAKIQVFYPLEGTRIYKRKGVEAWTMIGS